MDKNNEQQVINADFSSLRKFKYKKQNNNKKIISDSKIENLVSTIKENKEEVIEKIKEEDLNTNSFKNKSLKDSFFELEWKSFDPELIIDFLVFSSEILSGIKLFYHQKLFIERIFRSIIMREGADIIGIWSRQSGKTQTVSVAIATLCIVIPKLGKMFEELSQFERGFFAGIFAPTEKQSKITYNRVKSIVRSDYCKKFMEDPLIGVAVSSEGLKWDNGSIVFYGSAKMSSNIEGDTGHLIYIDEAQDVNEDVFKFKINPMRAFTNGTLVMTGLPSSNMFFKSKYNEAKVSSMFLDDKRKTLFEFDYKTVCKYNKFYEAFVKKQLKSEGENSFFFKRNFLLDWNVFKNLNSFYDVDLFIRNCSKDYLNFYEYSGGFVIAGLDLAYSGVSVLTIAEIIETDRESADFLYKETVMKIIGFYRFENLGTLDLQDKVANILIKYPNKYMFCFDNTGGGQYFVETFKRAFPELSGYVRSLNFNKQVKSHLTSLFDDLVRNRRIYFPSSKKAREDLNWNNFIKQLSTVELVESDHGIYFNSKNKYMFPDDYIDSFLLCINCFNDFIYNRGGFERTILGTKLKPNPHFEKGNSKFKYRFPYNRDSNSVEDENYLQKLRSNRIYRNLIPNL